MVVLALLFGHLLVTSPSAQEVGRLVVVVNDPSRAVIAGARVSITQGEPALVVTSALTGPDGSASFEALTPGRYGLTVEFAGFETAHVRDYRIRGGANRRVVGLVIQKVTEGLTVGRDKQDDGLDPGGSAFSTLLTREQIDALPDDPAELEAVLKAMSPPGATIRVDGFTGGRLPSKSQIRSIRLPRMDQFAAQNHGGMFGAMFIDIGTEPGNGALGGSIETALRDDALNARNPFTPAKGDENLRQGSVVLSGPVVRGRSSFSVDVGGARQKDAVTLLAALPDGQQAIPVHQTAVNSTVGGRFDTALGASHTLRAGARTSAARRGNVGVGAYDLPERAYTSSSRETTVRVSESGSLGRRAFGESRLELQWSRSALQSAFEVPTQRVIDAFTAGGAQQAGGRRAFELEAASDIDYVRGQHSYRAGVLVESARYRSDERSNYLGTFTFSSLADYQAGRPSLFSRRSGEASVRFGNTQVGAYVQDDYRVARSLLVSYGVRYEGQSLASDWWNLTPRATVTWSPWRSGRVTVRAAWGRFSDWLSAGVYEQVARVDGAQQREVMIDNPAFPDPGESGTAIPSNRYTLGDQFSLPATQSWTAGIDFSVSQPVRLSATFTNRSSSSLLRGVNDNPIVDGVRAIPEYREIIRAVADAGQRTKMAGINATFTWPRWRRTFIGVNYTLSSSESNTAGAFVLPASGRLDDEWGVSMPRHRAGVNASLRVRPNLSINVNARAQSGTPYSVTTGVDTNADGQFTDRLPGVARNTARTAATWDIGGRASYAIGFGGPARRGGAGGDQVVIRLGPGGGMEGGFDGGAEDSRYRLEFYVSGQNLTNHRNYTGYSGVMTSPFFGQPTDVTNPRKFEVGIRVGF